MLVSGVNLYTFYTSVIIERLYKDYSIEEKMTCKEIHEEMSGKRMHKPGHE